MSVLYLHGRAPQPESKLVDVDDAFEANGLAFVISLARWQADPSLRTAAGLQGLRLPNDVVVDELELDWTQFARVELEFPQFVDGRAYSQARLLRERLGYQGEIRAVGEVLRDQLNYMQRVGFDAFELPNTLSESEARKALDDFTKPYQSTPGRGAGVLEQRRSAKRQAS